MNLGLAQKQQAVLTQLDVIATVFRGVQNCMISRYLLRDVINKLNGAF
jgi:hypothetical protein